jgi:predicted RNase H-like HicB family nuclease
MVMHKYAIEIIYSEEDDGYIAIVPELPGCSAFGETAEQALKEIEIAMDLWLEVARNDNANIPKPQGKEMLAEICKISSNTSRLTKAQV